jgi:1-acyl-sn-glycerol-3-phosphate acyltransferase
MQPLGPVRTLIAKIGVGAATIVLACAAVSLGVVSTRAAARIVHLWGRCCFRLSGARLEVVGREHVEPGRRYVIMANHESSLDIVSLLTALPPSIELRFLAKKSLFKIPFLGWAMASAGFIPVDREDRSTAAATLAQTVEIVGRGGSPLVFPEETWTTDGRLLPFARGGFLVALKTGLPILPIGLEGPRLVLPPGEGVIRPGPVTVRLGGPIPTAGLGISQLAGLMARVRTEIDRLRGSDGHLPDADS